MVAGAIIVLFGAGADAEAGSVRIHERSAEKAEIEAATNLRFYEREVVLRNMAPKKFDEVHRLGGRMLSDESVYLKLLAEWKEHPARFEHDHRCLWHVLQGDMIYHEMHHPVPPSVPTLVIHGGNPVVTEDGRPGGGGSSGCPPGGGSGGGIHTTSVPEPSSAALLLSALVIVVLAAGRRRAYERFKPRPRCTGT